MLLSVSFLLVHKERKHQEMTIESRYLANLEVVNLKMMWLCEISILDCFKYGTRVALMH